MSGESSDSEAWAEAYSDSPSADKKKKVLRTAPPNLLTGRSFLEQQCHWFDHPDLLFDVFKYDDPVARLQQIVKWYFSALTGLHQIKDGEKVRKPYNPILGEQLHVKILDSEDRRVEMLSEQISHHPPLTAFHFENLDPGFSFSGVVGNRAKFRGTYMRVKTDGSATLVLRGNLNNETYTMTYPSVDVKGLLTGKTSAVLVGSATIDCPSTHLTARIKFSEKGAVKIRIAHVLKLPGADDGEGEEMLTELGTITGVWNKELTLQDNKKKSSGTVLWTARDVGTESRKYFKPTSLLTAMDSWKVWEMVTLHLAMGMFDKAGQFKHELEERERAKAKGRAAMGKPWAPALFLPVSHELRDLSAIRAMCEDPVWDGSTVEISLPDVTREPLDPAAM